MADQRSEVLKTDFTVASVSEQPEPWQTDGLIPEQMPTGFFVHLDPPLVSPDSDHFLVGLHATATDVRGISCPLPHSMWRLDDNGMIILFCDQTTDERPTVGTSIRFNVA